MVRSKTIHFSEKKITFFYEKKYCDWKCFDIEKKDEKSCDARFLGDKTVLRFFLVFKKKSKKSRFLRFFRKKAYGLRTILLKGRVIIYHAKLPKNKVKKNVKKKGFSFFETLF